MIYESPERSPQGRDPRGGRELAVGLVLLSLLAGIVFSYGLDAYCDGGRGWPCLPRHADEAPPATATASATVPVGGVPGFGWRPAATPVVIATPPPPSPWPTSPFGPATGGTAVFPAPSLPTSPALPTFVQLATVTVPSRSTWLTPVAPFGSTGSPTITESPGTPTWPGTPGTSTPTGTPGTATATPTATQSGYF